MDNVKKESEIKSKGRFSLRILIIIVIFSILIIMIALIFVFFYLYPFNSIKQSSFNQSREISSSYLSGDLSRLYIKLKTENISAAINNSLVKIMIKHNNGTVYYYNVNKTTRELLSEEVSIPKYNGILSFLPKQEDYNYDIKIGLSDIAGLASFNDISIIKVLFEPNTNPIMPVVNATTSVVANQTNNIAKPANRTTTKRRVTATLTTTDTKDSTETTASTNTNPAINCTATDWNNLNEYRCTSGFREIRQERTVCPSNDIEERWFASNCSQGYACYQGLGAPDEKCINDSLYCIDSDEEINNSINGFLNISNNIYNDSCYENKTLAEFYCYYNGIEFIADNQTSNCTFSCLDGACLVCTDLDNDSYSIDAGNCGDIDCNDTNPDINPAKQEVCENEIDENCDGITSCINLQESLVAYYKFNDSLVDNLAADETGYHDASCTSCPIYNETFGLNNSGSYEFNGISSILSLPVEIFNNNTYSLSFWMYPKTSSTDGMIIYSNAGSMTKGFLSLWFEGNRNSLYIYNNYGLDYQTSIDSIAPNEWTNMIIIYDYPNTQAKLYLDGILKTTITNFQQSSQPSTAMLGAKIDQKYFRGNMAEMRVYNRTLTNDEISYLSGEFSLPSLPSLKFLNIDIDSNFIFLAIILSLILIIIFVLFYLLSRIYKSQ